MTFAVALNRFGQFSRNALKIFIFTFFFFYFAYHLINGQNGLISYFKQKAKLEKMQTELSRVEEKRDELGNKVHKLYQNSLDADLLDEQYRRATGKIKPNEAVYYYED